MNYFQPNLVDTSYSADSNNALLIEDRYKAKNNFKRLGNEDLCGNAIDQNVSIRDAFTKTGALNPPVSMVPFIENSFGQKIELKNHQAIVDSVTGVPMSVMKKSYEIQDNEPICRIFEENQNILQLEHITTFNDKGCIFVSGGIKDADLEVTKNDPIRRRLCLINSYTGQYSFKLVLIDFRLFCFNQLGRVNRAQNKLSFRHSKGINEYTKALPEFLKHQREDLRNSIDELKAMVKVTYRNRAESMEVLKTLSQQMLQDKLIGKVKDKETKELRAKDFDKDLNKEWNDIKNNFIKETNNFEIAPNLYNMFNALNYQQTHCEQSVKDDIKGARVRLESLVSGKCGNRIDLIKKECLALTR
tara:strand:+ start:29 stop:1105 length:1077 start_codon:yes stop_codon:yes gene_type:complete